MNWPRKSVAGLGKIRTDPAELWESWSNCQAAFSQEALSEKRSALWCEMAE